MPKDPDLDIDILAKGRARQGLVVLLEAEKEGKRFLGAGEFETRLGVNPHLGRDLRAYYKHWGLATVEEGVESGRLFNRMSLTPRGREIAELFVKARKLAHGDAKLRPQERERA